jgi:hypothetical protein
MLALGVQKYQRLFDGIARGLQIDMPPALPTISDRADTAIVERFLVAT